MIRFVAIGIHLFSLITIAVISFFVLTRLKSSKREYFLLYMICGFLYVLGAMLEIIATTIDGGLIGWRITYLGGMLAAPMFIVFIQKYYEKPFPKLANFAIFASAAFVVLLTWTSRWHDLIYSSAHLYTDDAVRSVLVWGITRGVLWPAAVIQPALCMIISLVVLICKAPRSDARQRKKLYILIFCAAIPGISQILTLLNLYISGMYYTTVLIPLGSVLVYYGLFKYDLLENEETIRSQNWLKDMITNISHDLKTPLAVLSVKIEKLLHTIPAGTELARDAQTAYNKSFDLQRIIQNLIEVTRIESTQSLYKPEWMPLHDLLPNIQERYGDYAESAGLFFDVTGGGNALIFADPVKIWSVFDNIIYNAVRHTQNGGIAVSAKIDKDAVMITVTDTGCGITPEHLPHVFERFYKAASNRGSNTGDSGLGLYIVKNVMEGFGGRVRIESEPGAGTSVILVFMKKVEINGGCKT